MQNTISPWNENTRLSTIQTLTISVLKKKKKTLTISQQNKRKSGTITQKRDQRDHLNKINAKAGPSHKRGTISKGEQNSHTISTK